MQNETLGPAQPELVVAESETLQDIRRTRKEIEEGVRHLDHVDPARVRGALREGHAMLIKAPADARTCRQHPPSAALAQVLDRVRRAFDPDGRLNPGRME